MAQSFKAAFAAARKANKKEFMWNGKSYNSELRESVRPKARGETSTGPKPRPTTGPKPRPSTPVAKAAAKSPGGLMPDLAAIKAGNQAQREARRAARAEADKPKVTKASAPAMNKDDKSKDAVKKAMAKAAGAKFR